VPEECPLAIADLITRCMDSKPGNRPSAKDVVFILSEQVQACLASVFQMTCSHMMRKCKFCPATGRARNMSVGVGLSISCVSYASAMCIECHASAPYPFMPRTGQGDGQSALAADSSWHSRAVHLQGVKPHMLTPCCMQL
jgi:hypothetical protein